nr:MAG TPA: hypothetical protein [Caudoviricetes sp.]
MTYAVLGATAFFVIMILCVVVGKSLDNEEGK